MSEEETSIIPDKVWYKIKELKAKLAEAEERLKIASDFLNEMGKRSTHTWSSGPEYNDHDKFNEGVIWCAIEALTRIRGEGQK